MGDFKFQKARFDPQPIADDARPLLVEEDQVTAPSKGTPPLAPN
jgi:hypothetical protein